MALKNMVSAGGGRAPVVFVCLTVPDKILSEKKVA